MWHLKHQVSDNIFLLSRGASIHTANPRHIFVWRKHCMIDWSEHILLRLPCEPEDPWTYAQVFVEQQLKLQCCICMRVLCVNVSAEGNNFKEGDWWKARQNEDLCEPRCRIVFQMASYVMCLAVQHFKRCETECNNYEPLQVLNSLENQQGVSVWTVALVCTLFSCLAGYLLSLVGDSDEGFVYIDNGGTDARHLVNSSFTPITKQTQQNSDTQPTVGENKVARSVLKTKDSPPGSNSVVADSAGIRSSSLGSDALPMLRTPDFSRSSVTFQDGPDSLIPVSCSSWCFHPTLSEHACRTQTHNVCLATGT